MIQEGHEAAIAEGSVLETIWGKLPCPITGFSPITDKIQYKFPWYKHIHCLMGTSPTVSHVAVAHSASDLDLSALSCLAADACQASTSHDDLPDSPPSLPWDFNGITNPLSPCPCCNAQVHSQYSPDSHAGSQKFDDLHTKHSHIHTPALACEQAKGNR